MRGFSQQGISYSKGVDWTGEGLYDTYAHLTILYRVLQEEVVHDYECTVEHRSTTN